MKMKTMDDVVRAAVAESEREKLWIRAGMISYLACYRRLTKADADLIHASFMAGALHTYNVMTEPVHRDALEEEGVGRIMQVADELRAHVEAAVASLPTEGHG